MWRESEVCVEKQKIPKIKRENKLNIRLKDMKEIYEIVKSVKQIKKSEEKKKEK